jgi:hypothetical protein
LPAEHEPAARELLAHPKIIATAIIVALVYIMHLFSYFVHRATAAIPGVTIKIPR